MMASKTQQKDTAQKPHRNPNDEVNIRPLLGGEDKKVNSQTQAVLHKDQDPLQPSLKLEPYGDLSHFFSFLMEKVHHKGYEPGVFANHLAKKSKIKNLKGAIALLRTSITQEFDTKDLSNEDKVSVLEEIDKIQTLEDFYMKVEYIYTMATCFHRHLNDVLRKERWEEMENLLPYLIYFIKAAHVRSHEVRSNIYRVFPTARERENKYLKLYRGTSLSKTDLQFYIDLLKNPRSFFSWLGVSSTSIDKAKANFFFKRNNANEVPVMFVIYVQLDSRLINFSQLFFILDNSSFAEKEVIISCGTILNIENITGDDKIGYTIELGVHGRFKKRGEYGLIPRSRQKDMSKNLKERVEDKKGYFEVLVVVDGNVNEVINSFDTAKDTLEIIRTDISGLSETNLDRFLKYVKSLPKLKSLQLNNRFQALTPTALSILAGHLTEIPLQKLHLNLEKSSICFETMKNMLAGPMKIIGIHALSLHLEGMSKEDYMESLVYLSQQLPNTNITELYLGPIHYIDVVKSQIEDYLPKWKIDKLVLKDVQMKREKGNVDALVECLQLIKPTHLIVRETYYSKPGFTSLSRVLEIPSLKTLSLRALMSKAGRIRASDQMEPIRADKFCELLPKSNLKNLEIHKLKLSLFSLVDILRTTPKSKLENIWLNILHFGHGRLAHQQRARMLDTLGRRLIQNVPVSSEEEKADLRELVMQAGRIKDSEKLPSLRLETKGIKMSQDTVDKLLKKIPEGELEKNWLDLLYYHYHYCTPKQVSSMIEAFQNIVKSSAVKTFGPLEMFKSQQDHAAELLKDSGIEAIGKSYIKFPIFDHNMMKERLIATTRFFEKNKLVSKKGKEISSEMASKIFKKERQDFGSQPREAKREHSDRKQRKNPN